MMEAVPTMGESVVLFRASDEHTTFLGGHPIRGLQGLQDGVFGHAEAGLAVRALLGLGVGLDTRVGADDAVSDRGRDSLRCPGHWD